MLGAQRVALNLSVWMGQSFPYFKEHLSCVIKHALVSHQKWPQLFQGLADAGLFVYGPAVLPDHSAATLETHSASDSQR